MSTIRTKLANVSKKNKSLQDILGSLKVTKTIQSIEKHLKGIHNTKIVVELQTDNETLKKERRVHFYNRLDLATLLADVEITGTSIQDVILSLNLQGFDFNTDDLELVDGKIKAKENSLGYFGEYPFASSCNMRLYYYITLRVSSALNQTPDDDAELVRTKILESIQQQYNDYGFPNTNVRYQHIVANVGSTSDFNYQGTFFEISNDTIWGAPNDDPVDVPTQFYLPATQTSGDFDEWFVGTANFNDDSGQWEFIDKKSLGVAIVPILVNTCLIQLKSTSGV